MIDVMQHSCNIVEREPPARIQGVTAGWREKETRHSEIVIEGWESRCRRCNGYPQMRKGKSGDDDGVGYSMHVRCMK